MVEVTTTGGATISDIIVWLAGENWSSFSNDNGAGIRLLTYLTSQGVE
jgi:hypothetical protein